MRPLEAGGDEKSIATVVEVVSIGILKQPEF
jgi:hypothetical protein